MGVFRASSGVHPLIQKDAATMPLDEWFVWAEECANYLDPIAATLKELAGLETTAPAIRQPHRRRHRRLILFSARILLILAGWRGFSPLIVPMYLPWCLRAACSGAAIHGLGAGRPM